jgi:hypothetical protein
VPAPALLGCLVVGKWAFASLAHDAAALVVTLAAAAMIVVFFYWWLWTERHTGPSR